MNSIPLTLWVSLCWKRRSRELRTEPGEAGGLPTLALQGHLSIPTCQLQCKTSALACFAQETQLQGASHGLCQSQGHGRGRGTSPASMLPSLLPDSTHHPPAWEPELLLSWSCWGARSVSQTWTQVHLEPWPPPAPPRRVSKRPSRQFQDTSHISLSVPHQITLPPSQGLLTHTHLSLIPAPGGL